MTFEEQDTDYSEAALVRIGRARGYGLLYGLVTGLERRGVTVTLDQRVRLVGLLARLKDMGISLDTADAAHGWLSPVVVRSAEEAAVLRRALEAHFAELKRHGEETRLRQEDAPPPVTDKLTTGLPGKLQGWSAAALLGVIIAAAAAVVVWWLPDPCVGPDCPLPPPPPPIATAATLTDVLRDLCIRAAVAAPLLLVLALVLARSLGAGQRLLRRRADGILIGDF